MLVRYSDKNEIYKLTYGAFTKKLYNFALYLKELNLVFSLIKCKLSNQ